MRGAELGLIGGALALGGVLVWRQLDKIHDAKTLLPGVSTPAGVSTSPFLPSGTTAATRDDVGTVGRNQEAIQRQNQIDQLRRDLARTWNDIDEELVRANGVKNRPVDEAFKAAVANRVWSDCRNSGAWLTQAQRCNNVNMAPAVAQAIKTEWAARIAADLAPYQARLSRLNSEQMSIIQNLAALGYQVPAGQKKDVNA